jgi:hypothetical protein
VHVHTRLSHDSPGPLEELLEGARAADLRWICLTEHSTDAQATDLPRGDVGGVLLIPGEEMSKNGGAVLALGTEGPVRRPGTAIGETLDDVRAAGGLAFLGHVADMTRPPRRAPDGVAVYDVTTDLRAVPLLRAPGLAALLLRRDADRIAEGFHLFLQRRPDAGLALWDDYLADAPCTAVAETNTHARFRFFGATIDPYGPFFALVRNHALVRGEGEAAVLDALREGRVHIGFDVLADSTGFRFEAHEGDAAVAAAGSTLPWSPALSLVVHLPAPARVRLLRDGVVLASGEGRVHAWPPPGPGVYRVEADLPVAGEDRPWVISNAIRVTPRDSSRPATPFPE